MIQGGKWPLIGVNVSFMDWATISLRFFHRYVSVLSFADLCSKMGFAIDFCMVFVMDFFINFCRL